MTFRDALAERMARPQRHRLLQGFPAVPAMVAAAPDDETRREVARRFAVFEGAGLVRGLDGALVDEGFAAARAALEKPEPAPLPQEPDTPEWRALREQSRARVEEQREQCRRIVEAGDRSEAPRVTIDATRALIVGVIPHTQCVPRREACGFCTFPHDAQSPLGRSHMIDAVCGDIERLTGRAPLAGRSVEAIYLGGGTANLSTPEQVTQIVKALARHLRIDGAELTLEGTPRLFEGLFFSHLKNLAALPVGQRRISMGIQTFDDGFLRLMGRERFGDAALVRKLVKRCRALAITTSGDLLFNLPGQTPAQMDHDVDTALDAGLDQICLYHLVLYPGLGTPWANDAALVALAPDNARACESWLRLRERLLAAGYVQSTLTNFERKDVAEGPQRFRYETASFSAERTDAVGFGPLSLSTFVNWREKRGIKLLRRKNLGPAPWSGADLMFGYDEHALRLLFLTRGLARTRVDGATYRGLFGTELQEDFREALPALVEQGLIALEGDTLALTPRGMFYADAVVSLLAVGVPRAQGEGKHTRDLLREVPRAGDYYGMG